MPRVLPDVDQRRCLRDTVRLDLEYIKMRAKHPGELLLFKLASLNTSGRAFAIAIKVPPSRVIGILKGERGITADTAIRLGMALEMSSKYWFDLQQSYDIKIAKQIGNFCGIYKLKPKE